MIMFAAYSTKLDSIVLLESIVERNDRHAEHHKFNKPI